MLTLIDSSDLPIDLRRDLAIFESPHWLIDETPAWIGHIPFAWWLVAASQPRAIVELGTHYGNSYFAFCQRVRELSLDCSTFAVDTWVGDEHSGMYGEEVYKRVAEHNARHYRRFSSLVRSTFDEASDHFSDGEIDLLHIDGHHTYQSVKHDFDLWLPKLSGRSIVVFHDIAVRERGFGVHRLWKEIEARYPTFAFDHSHGLGVAGIGPDQSPACRSFFASDEDVTVAVKTVFASLGGALLLGAEVQRERDTEQSRLAAVLRELEERMTLEAEAERNELTATFRKRLETLRDEHDRRIEALEIQLKLAEERAAAEFDARLAGRRPS